MAVAQGVPGKPAHLTCRRRRSSLKKPSGRRCGFCAAMSLNRNGAFVLAPGIFIDPLSLSDFPLQRPLQATYE
jgi:hypothetical protein